MWLLSLYERDIMCNFSITLGKPLGEGAFGVVMQGEARGLPNKQGITTVAVKMLKGQLEPSRQMSGNCVKCCRLFIEYGK